jgi:NADH-ubiquinone oxidoreductase chain 5
MKIKSFFFDLFMAVGLSQYNVALFHLVNHAFFKALLFLAAGGVLHSMNDQQDLRRLGGLVNFLPFTYTAILVGSLSLMAFPFLTGMYSKELIIELAAAQYSFTGHMAYWLGTITAGITAFYSYRLISMTFFTTANARKADYEHTHEQPLIVAIPYVVLMIFSIFFGYVASDLFVGMASDALATSLFIHPNHITLVEAEFASEPFYKTLPTYLSIVAAVLAFAIYNYPSAAKSISSLILPSSPSIVNKITKPIYLFLNGKWLFDVVYNKYILSGGLYLGLLTSKVIDKGVVELLGPYGLSNTLSSTSKSVSYADTGIVTHYALYITLGLLIFLLIVFAPIILGSPLLSSDISNIEFISVPNTRLALVFLIIIFASFWL